MAIILFFLLSILVCGTSAVHIMPELKQNVLRFAYRVKSIILRKKYAHQIKFERTSINFNIKIL